MTSKDKVYATAMQAELEALEQYLSLARQAGGAGVTELFLHLAQDELAHFKVLKARADGASPKRIHIESTAWDRILKASPTRKASSIVGRQHLEVLKQALQNEAQAESYYREQAQAETNADAVDLWVGLANMEKIHGELIKSQIDEIERSGFWLDYGDVWSADQWRPTQ